MYKKLMIFSVTLLVLSCGGGGSSFKTSKETKTSAYLNGGYLVSSVSQYKVDSVSLTVEAVNEDIFPKEVIVKSVKLEYYDELTGEKRREKNITVIRKIENTGSLSLSVPVMEIADKLSPPYTYINEVNPTTFGATYYTEILAVPKYALIGKGKCEEQERCTTVNGQQTCEFVKVCKRDFQGTIEDRLPGTLVVTDGKSFIKEEQPGVLTGDGSGIVQGNTVYVSFQTPPEDGSLVVAYYLSKPKPLSRDYLRLKIAYGDTLIEEENGLLKVNNNYVGEIDENGNLKFYSSLGYKNSPLVAFYYGSPTVGGEFAGWGNRGEIYKLTTKYKPVDPQSVKVIAEGNGFSEEGFVQWVEAATGKITVVFPRPVPEGVPIYVQYRVSDLFEKVKVYVNLVRDGKNESIYAGEFNLHVTK